MAYFSETFVFEFDCEPNLRFTRPQRRHTESTEELVRLHRYDHNGTPSCTHDQLGPPAHRPARLARRLGPPGAARGHLARQRVAHRARSAAPALRSFARTDTHTFGPGVAPLGVAVIGHGDLSPEEAAKRMAAYAAVDGHVKDHHKVLGIGCVSRRWLRELGKSCGRAPS